MDSGHTMLEKVPYYDVWSWQAWSGGMMQVAKYQVNKPYVAYDQMSRKKQKKQLINYLALSYCWSIAG